MSARPSNKKDAASKPIIEKTGQLDIDPLDEAGMESFPASDPPAYTGSTASRSKAPPIKQPTPKSTGPRKRK